MRRNKGLTAHLRPSRQNISQVLPHSSRFSDFRASCWSLFISDKIALIFHLLFPPQLSFNLVFSTYILIPIMFLSFQLQKVLQILNVSFLFDQHLPVLYLHLQTDTCIYTHILTQSLFCFQGSFPTFICHSPFFNPTLFILFIAGALILLLI